MTRDVYEMKGTIVAWGDITGEILTDDGERIYLCPQLLQFLGIKQTPKIGDQIYFYASQRIEIEYHVEAVRMLVPSAPDNAKLRQLKELNRALRKERNPNEVWSVADIERFTGAVECYDPKEGGFIAADTGERVKLDELCVRSSRFQSPAIGDRIAFSAHETASGWSAISIFSLGNQRRRPFRSPQRKPRKPRNSQEPKRG